MKVKAIVSMILFPVLSVVGERRGDPWTFHDPKPKYDNYRINACFLDWDRDCADSRQAADDFCRTQGFKGVEGGDNFELDPKSTWHTNKLIGTGQIHPWYYGKSKSFKKITCAGEGEFKRVFDEPKYENYDLDYCFSRPTFLCGEYVANAFCRMKGFKEAESYLKAWQWDGNSTKSIATGLLCHTHQQECDTFEYIACTSNPPK